MVVKNCLHPYTFMPWLLDFWWYDLELSSETRKWSTLIRVLLVWLGGGVLVVVLPGRQQNSLRKRGAVDNFVVGIFLACNFIKVESENLVRQVLKERILSKIPQDPPPPVNKTFTSTHPMLTSPHIIGKVWLHHKNLVLLNEMRFLPTD